MRRHLVRWAIGAGVAAIAIPVIAQQAPESLLPPGFGDPVPEQAAPPPRTNQSSGQSSGQASGSSSGQSSTAQSSGLAVPAPLNLDLAAPDDSANAIAEAAMSDEELAAERQKYDLPDTARRLLSRIGALTPETRGFAPDAFGAESGRYLASLMKTAKAPVASRWASILLRRALLSATDTPADIDGADWAAERAWLLLRMGEADSARLLVQSVDPDKYTPRLYAVAMQTYLATADPAGMCPLSTGALRVSKEPSWEMSQAICSSLSGDQGSASGALNQAQRRNVVRGIDYRLTEKVVGAGFNARRSVKIEWEGVDRLTPWRFGLATATNVEIPDALYGTAGPQVRAWEARAPMLSLARRRIGVETAARLGVWSSDALVDYYAALAASDDAPVEARDRAEALRNAFAGGSVNDRIDAMRSLWTLPDGEGTDYVGLLATARAAAVLPATSSSSEDMSRLIAAMLSAGYDRSAARWARVVAQTDDAAGQQAWAMLAVGAPSPVVDIAQARVSAYAGAVDPAKAKLLIAGLAGLNRLSAADMGKVAGEAGLSLAPRGKWARAIAAAAERREPATVALLAAVGMQVSDWRNVPAENLYHIVAALHRVGLDPEARMIAAEAIART
jgi:hypothetical protein